MLPGDELERLEQFSHIDRIARARVTSNMGEPFQLFQLARRRLSQRVGSEVRPFRTRP